MVSVNVFWTPGYQWSFFHVSVSAFTFEAGDFRPLREMGFHLWPKQWKVFIWMRQKVFAPSKVMETLRFADATNQTRQLAKYAQIAGRMIVRMSFVSFTFLFLYSARIE